MLRSLLTYSWQSLARRRCDISVGRRRRFRDRLPFWCFTRVVAASAASACSISMTLQIDGWLWPSMHSNRRFHASAELFVRSPSFSVSSWTFHVVGGKRGRRRRALRSGIVRRRRPTRTVDVGRIKILDQWPGSRRHNSAQMIESGGDITDWQKRQPVQHAAEETEVFVAFVVCDQAQFLHINCTA